jgi:hypothetical protein
LYFWQNAAYKPTSRDIKTYTEVLDVDKDGQVTLGDLEQLAVQYLCGPGVLSTAPAIQNYKAKKTDTPSFTPVSYATPAIRPSSSNQ